MASWSNWKPVKQQVLDVTNSGLNIYLSIYTLSSEKFVQLVQPVESVPLIKTSINAKLVLYEHF